jgi:hypothetical protein
MNRNFINLRGNWREQRDSFEEALKIARQNLEKMSQFERETIGKELKDFTEGQGKQILSQALEEYHAKLDDFCSKQAKVERERVKEIASWDPSRLAPEMQVFQMRVENALYADDPARELQSIYSEAKQSEDRYKLRAAADALRQVNRKSGSLPLEVKTKLNGVMQAAQRDLAEIRTTPGMEAAVAEAKQAFDVGIAAHKELQETDAIINMQDPNFNYFPSSPIVLRALSRVQTDDRGNSVVSPRNDRQE